MPSKSDDQDQFDNFFASATGALALADGSCFFGHGFGAEGTATGEACFNTAMTGYQEILTDPSYAAQIVVFTFPHIGNTGTNDQDVENAPEANMAGTTNCAGTRPSAAGVVVREKPTDPSNWRNGQTLRDWARARGLIGVYGVDTRGVTVRIRERGVLGAAIAHSSGGGIDTDSLVSAARGFSGLSGMELALEASIADPVRTGSKSASAPHAVVLDLGSKSGILRALAERGARITLLPATSSIESIMAVRPDGVVLSNGPGDPSATIPHIAPVIRALVEADMPMLAICLGHQLLALSLGARTVKMDQGHHGANHPVQDIRSGQVYITSMNHAFAVDGGCLPDRVTQTQISLFDGSNCALTVEGKPIISVQYHPEASPGPRDAMGLFDQFMEMMKRS